MTNRRKFLKKLGGSAVALSFAQNVFANETRILREKIKISSNDKVRIGLIGSGIIGHYDTDTALRVPGVEIVAVCDLYDGRLERAKEKWGSAIFTTRDYREILNKKDIDAVLICVPDHWHSHISIDALNAGKHVYCEKPMVKKIEEGHAVIAAHKKSGKVFQVGSQRASSLAILEAKKYFEQGLIGDLTYVEAVCDRSDARGAWQYSIPTDASPQNIDFDKFLGNAPKVPFDPVRFFRWRNYKDYGTGVGGDLFVHLLTGLHTITGSLGPSKIFGLGAINYWKDGRDAYDICTALMDYQKSPTHPAFQFLTRVNLSDGAGGALYCKLIGTEGIINMGWSEFTVKHFKRGTAPGYGGYDSFDSFSAKQKEDYKKWYNDKYGEGNKETTQFPAITYKAEPGYDDRLSHMTNFFESIRSGKVVAEDSTFGLRAAGPSIAANVSVEKGKAVKWDNVAMKIR